MEKVEFGSPAWIELMADLFQRAATASPTRPPDVTLCEIYRNAPPHLAPAGQRDIAWTLTLRDGVVTMTPQACPDGEADRKSEGEYDEIIHIARLIVTPANGADYAARVAELGRSGKYRKIKELPANRGGMEAFADLHNLMARATK